MRSRLPDMAASVVERAGRWAALSAASRQPTRPVRVDDEGRIFEVTGERFIMPGLAPEDVLAGLADVRAGRTVPLKELAARRHSD